MPNDAPHRTPPEGPRWPCVPTMRGSHSYHPRSSPHYHNNDQRYYTPRVLDPARHLRSRSSARCACCCPHTLSRRIKRRAFPRHRSIEGSLVEGQNTKVYMYRDCGSCRCWGSLLRWRQGREGKSKCGKELATNFGVLSHEKHFSARTLFPSVEGVVA